MPHTSYNISMKKIIVTEKYNNKKLNQFILDSFPNLNLNTLHKALRKKDVRVNGKRINEKRPRFRGRFLQKRRP